MKTEREAFDLWFKKNFHDLHESICCGDLVAKNYKKAMFKSWCASASREGYKLVPVELLKRCIGHIATAECHQNNSKQDEELMANDMELIEQAMVGEVE